MYPAHPVISLIPIANSRSAVAQDGAPKRANPGSVISRHREARFVCKHSAHQCSTAESRWCNICEVQKRDSERSMMVKEEMVEDGARSGILHDVDFGGPGCAGRVEEDATPMKCLMC